MATSASDLKKPDETSLYNWVNITDEFKQACEKLEIGQLLKDENFGLFEAMSAIEMMDPKMDAGMLAKQNVSKIKSFKQAVDEKLLKVNDFTLEEKISIVDNTLCHLVTWLDGASLAQTMLTNLYLHDPALVEDNYMKWFSIVMLKLIDLIRFKVMSASVYEEEDFQPLHYSFNLASDVTDQACIAALKLVEDESAKIFRNYKNENTSDETQKNMNLANGLWSRIKFLRHFYQTMLLINDNVIKSIDDITKHINNSTEALKKFEATTILNEQIKYVKYGKTTFPIVLGFEPSINQRLLPPTFPRFIHIYSFDATVKDLNLFFDQLLVALQTITKVNSNFAQLFDFSLKFSLQNQSVLLRSILQLMIMPRNLNQRNNQMKELLQTTIFKFIAPPVLQPKSILYNKDICAQIVDTFLTRCSPTFVNLLQILGHNRARQREKFGHILEDFAALQEEADNLDRILHSFLAQEKSPLNHLAYFGSWIMYNSLSIMSLYVLSGFELELYSKYEYYYVYWYMCEIILNWQLNTVRRVDQFLSLYDANATQQNSKANKKVNKKKAKSIYEKEMALLTANRHMHSACYQAIKALTAQEFISMPNKELDCEEFRYNHRFGTFQYFNTPPLCFYFQFKQKDQQFTRVNSPNQIYSYAQDHFEQARAIYEKYPESSYAVACAKVAKNNFVVMRLLSSGLKKATKVDLDFKEQVYFPLIKI